MSEHKASKRSIRSTAALPVAAIMLAFVAASCGGDDSTDGQGSVDGDTTAFVEDAQKRIDEAASPLTFEPPGPSIQAAELEGKKVRIVNSDQRVPILAQTAAAAQEAGEEAGIEVEIFDAGSDPSRMVQGVEQGVQDADAMVLLAIPTPLVADSVRQAQERGVPVVSALDTQPIPNEPGQGAGDEFFGNITTDIINAGELVASAVVAETDGDARVAIFSTNDTTPSGFVVEGMKNVFDQCEGCTIVEEIDTPPIEWETKLAQRAQAVIREHPDLDFILPVFDGMSIFVIPAVDQAGAGDRVKVATFNGTPAALEFMQTGDTLVADPGQLNEWTGWASLDQAMRGMLETEPADPVIPVRFFKKSDIEDADLGNADALFGDPEFREGFRELWGLGQQ